MKPFEDIEALVSFYSKFDCKNVLTLLSHPVFNATLHDDRSIIDLEIESRQWATCCMQAAQVHFSLSAVASIPDELINSNIRAHIERLDTTCIMALETFNTYFPSVKIQ